MRGKFCFLDADIWFDVKKCKFILKDSSLTIIWMGSLGVRFEVEGGKITAFV